MDYQYQLMPSLSADEYEILKADIAERGVQVPIEFDERGNILDGHHRLQACAELGIKNYPSIIRPGMTEQEKVHHVLTLNLARRHLEREQRRELVNKLRQLGWSTRKIAGVVKVDKQTVLNDLSTVENSTVDRIIGLDGKSRPAKMPAVIAKNTNEQQRVFDAYAEIPELEINSADIVTASDVQKIVKQTKRAEEIKVQVEEITANKYLPPAGKFDVIAIDPPWPYGTQYDPFGRRAANPYPEMSLEEIKAIQLPAADDCVLWLWTTHKFMRYSFDLLDAWGFRDVAIVTWVKDRMGLGSWLRSQSEFCIMAVKGNPTVNLTNQTTIITGPLREHSRKPDEFYTMVSELCPGYKIDWFSRESREGWAQYGNETNKF